MNIEQYPESAVKLIRRIMALPPGTHLLVISKGKTGLDLLSVLASSKTEVLRAILPAKNE